MWEWDFIRYTFRGEISLNWFFSNVVHVLHAYDDWQNSSHWGSLENTDENDTKDKIRFFHQYNFRFFLTMLSPRHDTSTFQLHVLSPVATTTFHFSINLLDLRLDRLSSNEKIISFQQPQDNGILLPGQ